MAKITVAGITVEVPDGQPVNIVSNNGCVSVSGSQVYSMGSGSGTRQTVDLKIEGAVASIKADGNVDCGDISGDVDAGGSVECKAVGGSIDSGGSVTCGNVQGSVDAGGSVTCGAVGGDVDAGGSVRMGR